MRRDCIIARLSEIRELASNIWGPGNWKVTWAEAECAIERNAVPYWQCRSYPSAHPLDALAQQLVSELLRVETRRACVRWKAARIVMSTKLEVGQA